MTLVSAWYRMGGLLPFSSVSMCNVQCVYAYQREDEERHLLPCHYKYTVINLKIDVV